MKTRQHAPSRLAPSVASTATSADRGAERRVAPVAGLIGAALACFACSLLAAPAVAQNALGSGDALDAGLQLDASGRRMRYNAATPREDYRLRNLVVTGGVSGGRAFRGSVGYTAPGDFRARLGSDNNYAFERDSAQSSALFVNSRAQVDRYRVAEGLGEFQYRRSFTPLSSVSTVGQASALNDSRIRLDQSTRAITSGSLFSSSVGLESAGILRDPGSEQLVNISRSPLQGIVVEPLSQSERLQNLDPFERAQVRSAVQSRELRMSEVGRPWEGPLGVPGSVEARIEDDLDRPTANADARLGGDLRVGARADARVGGERDTGPEDVSEVYERVVREIVERYGDDESVRIDADARVVDRVREDIERVRGGVNRPERSGADRATQPGTRSETVDTSDLRDGASTATGDDAEEGTESTGADDRLRELSPDEIRAIGTRLSHDQSAESLSEGLRGRVKELVAQGEAAIADGGYFLAERRFDQALVLEPGNPMALAGRANAQLGAGLYLSCAFTLRKLFFDHPELIDLRYGEAIRPTPERLRAAVETIRARLVDDDQDATNYGLVLAFAGHQLEEPAVIMEGLAFISESPVDARMRELLRAIWLEPATPSGDEAGD